MNKVRLGLGFAFVAWIALWAVLQAPYLTQWEQGFVTGCVASAVLNLFLSFAKGVHAGWKKAHQS